MKAIGVRQLATWMGLLLTLGYIASAAAAPPNVIAFQGQMLGAAGTPLPDGTYSTTFRLYDQKVGGTPLWAESKSVTVARGTFSTALGDTQAFPPTLLFDQPYFLGVQVGLDPEMTPRLALASVPYARSVVEQAPGASGPATVEGSPLAGISRAKAGYARQAGSKDTTGGNADFRAVDPGQTITLFDAQGPGIVQRFWCTIAPRANLNLHAQCILRMYWDGETTPSVEVPIGAFFGVGFGQQIDYTSLPLNENSGGYNSYWEMPFRQSARWTLTNLSNTRMDAFYYNIDYTAYDALPNDLQYFHAQWRRENPTSPGQNYTILNATGEGHYVGTALFMQNREGTSLWFLEGDEMFYMDGETTPSISGTGTEDYFSSGWYFDRGTYSAPYHGVVLKDTTKGRISAYRWHIEDSKPFHQSIRATIEHGTNNDTEGDYSSVAYWYQAEPHAPFPPLPSNPANLLPSDALPPYIIPNAIEGENLVPTAQASNGSVAAQDMSVFGALWSNDAQLWWQPAGSGATLTLHVPAPAAGQYTLTGYFTKARDYGTIQVKKGSQLLGSAINLYSPSVAPTGAVSLGTVSLDAGDNVITILVTGKDAASINYMVGLDAFVLTPS